MATQLEGLSFVSLQHHLNPPTDSDKQEEQKSNMVPHRRFLNKQPKVFKEDRKRKNEDQDDA